VNYTVVVKNIGEVYSASEVVMAFFKPDITTIPLLRDSSTPVSCDLRGFAIPFHLGAALF
jgi:hypothetical protein